MVDLLVEFDRKRLSLSHSIPCSVLDNFRFLSSSRIQMMNSVLLAFSDLWVENLPQIKRQNKLSRSCFEQLKLRTNLRLWRSQRKRRKKKLQVRLKMLVLAAVVEMFSKKLQAKMDTSQLSTNPRSTLTTNSWLGSYLSTQRVRKFSD